jgi:hypothetical protein
MVNIFPFNQIFNKTKIGEEINFYSIKDGQYATVIGEMYKTRANKVVIDKPMYVTKQKSYIETKLHRRKKNVRFLVILFGLVLFYLIQKFIRKGYKYLLKKQIVKL